MFKIQSLFPLLLFTVITLISAENFTAIYVTSKLPSGRSQHPVIYDGLDTIYIFGGWNSEGYPHDILKFSISEDTITKIGNISYGLTGSLQMDSLGDIFHFHFSEVWKFNTTSRSISKVATLPYSTVNGATVKYNETHVMILSGNSQCRETLLFDLQSYDITTLQPLPYCYESVRAVQDGQGNAYLIGQGGNRTVVKLNMETLATEIIFSGLPEMVERPEVVTDGSKMYIIGGYRSERTDGVLTFDWNTLEYKFNVVKDFVIEPTSTFWHPPSCVFIEKLNRIYYSGGDAPLTLREIWYLDLPPTETEPTTTEGRMTTGIPSSTMDPDIFTCFNKTDGLYPHPYDCSLFIGCHLGQTDIFECPPPLLFDPLLVTCNHPDLVDCDLSCADKPDGPHPHPHDCSLFITCFAGKLDIYKCPEPLLFDPTAKMCRYPDLVVCDP